MFKFEIDVDNRIGSYDLIDDINRLSGNKGHLCKLNSGDVAFSGHGPDGIVRIGIERKNISDYVESLSSGRLDLSQLRRMAKTFHASYLIIEGYARLGHENALEYVPPSSNHWVVHPNRAMSYTRFIGSQVSIMNRKVYIARTLTPLETAVYCVRLWEWWQQPWEKHESADVYTPSLNEAAVRTENGVIMYSRLPTSAQSVWQWAATCPHVGAKAALLAREFQTMEQLVNAPLTALALILGRGVALSGVWERLHGRLPDMKSLPKVRAESLT